MRCDILYRVGSLSERKRTKLFFRRKEIYNCAVGYACTHACNSYRWERRSDKIKPEYCHNKWENFAGRQPK